VVVRFGVALNLSVFPETFRLLEKLLVNIGEGLKQYTYLKDAHAPPLKFPMRCCKAR